nr:MAG TPA: HNH endonuclease bacteriophage, HNH Endonuclease, DNA.52A [Caudoviricetes sp.]
MGCSITLLLERVDFTGRIRWPVGGLIETRNRGVGLRGGTAYSFPCFLGSLQHAGRLGLGAGQQGQGRGVARLQVAHLFIGGEGALAGLLQLGAQPAPPAPPRRKRVLERCGYRCEWMITREERCPEKATDVDHIKPGDDHSFRNLRGLCGKHHARKSSSEGWWARKRLIEESKQKFRKQETHPAYLNADGSMRGGMLNVEDSDANKPARRRQAEPRRSRVSWRSPTDQNTPPPQTVA